MNIESKKERLIKKFETDSKTSKSKGEKCKLVYLWCSKMLQHWSDNLEREIEQAGKDNLTAEIKLSKNVYMAAKTNLKPLIRALRNEKCEDDILDHLYLIIQYCIFKEYVRANDVYMKLCIGNSPWPMGVTMVGIHERSGRSKINTSKVAHILNDET